MKRKKVHVMLTVGALISFLALSVEAAVPKKELTRTAAESGVDVNVGKGTKEVLQEEMKVRPMYRLFSKVTMEHFYTDSEHERDVLKTRGWMDEGIGWYAPEKSKTPVYRLYNTSLMDHHYTTSVYERDTLVKNYGWISEGIGWYSDDGKEVPLYRRYCSLLVSGAHHYTTARREADYLVSVGWMDEGIAWYGVNPEDNQKEQAATTTPGQSATIPDQRTTPAPGEATAETGVDTPETGVTVTPGFAYNRGIDLSLISAGDYAQMVLNTHKDFLDLKLEAGAINSSNGTKKKSAAALRSAELLELNGLVVLLNALPSKYKTEIYRYTSDGAYIANMGKTKAMASFRGETGYKYRLAIYPADAGVAWNEKEAEESVKAAYLDSFRGQLREPEGIISLAHMGYYANDAMHMNTLEAFRWAWILGYDGSEIDVNVSKDGVPFICHDPSKTGVDKVKYNFKEMTWEEIRNTVFWNDGTVVPSLDEVLAQAEKYGYMLLLDLKGTVTTEKAVEIARKVNESGTLKAHTIFASTNLSHLAAIRKEAPDTPVLILTKDSLDLEALGSGSNSNMKTIKRLLADEGETMVALSPDKCADDTYYEALKETGFTLIIVETKMSGDLKHFAKYCDYYCSFNAGTAAYGLRCEM
uniref:Glycerophosphoryl diester phosphodiesterase n=1 Tax=Eubacterium cellulosolvens (strain ATCC 43171 / JCM 9499 / 6) TaxID=633697 RepID=I5AVP2_EUBC6